MAFTVPTLNDFVRTAENGLASSFRLESSMLRKGVLKALARTFAGVSYLLALMLRKMWQNVFVNAADVETLKDFGVEFNVPNKPESYASGKVTVRSENASVTIPQGTVLVREDGTEYEVVADTVLTGGTDGTAVNVLAVSPGEDGDAEPGTALSFRDGTPERTESEAVVCSDGLTGGRRVEVKVNGNTEYWGESVEEYRARLLAYRRNPPNGGSAADYRNWCERFQKVSRCIVAPNWPVAGSVTCFLCHFDDGDSVEVDGETVDEVNEYVNSDVRRPVTATVSAVSVTDRAIAFDISVAPNNENVRKSVRTALRDALRSYAPGDTVDAARLTVSLLGSSIAEKISVSGMDGSLSVSLDKASGGMPVIGSVNWSDYE